MEPMRAVAPTTSRLIVKRDGKAITSPIPKPVVLVDTREQVPLDFSQFGNWIEGVERATLKTGDYTCLGMENLLVIERKSLNDLISTLMHNRGRFFAECERMTEYRYRAILVEASLMDVKSPYDGVGIGVSAHPNGVAGTLDAIECKFQIPVIYTSRHRGLAAEKAASYLSKHFTYHWLESNGMGRVLQPGDL